MTTDIAIPAPHGPSLPEKLEYARYLAESGLLPAHYRKQPANVLYAYEYGEMLGLAPIAAITGIHVIEGKPSASSALMSALVRRAGHRLRITGDDETATAEITRSDDPGFTFRSQWTIQRAKQAGLTGKDVWKKYPAAMLKARAVAEVVRDACEEELLGMHYTPEELGAETDEDGIPVQVTAERVADGPPEPVWETLIPQYENTRNLTGLGDLWRDAKRLRPKDADLRRRIEEAAKRVPVDVADGEIVEPETPVGITEKQSKRLHALLSEGQVNRETKLALLSHLTGREVTTSAELTEAEADTVIQKVADMAKSDVSLIETIVELIDRTEDGDPS